MAGRSLTQLPGSCPITWFVIAANAATFVVAYRRWWLKRQFMRLMRDPARRDDRELH